MRNETSIEQRKKDHTLLKRQLEEILNESASLIS